MKKAFLFLAVLLLGALSIKSKDYFPSSNGEIVKHTYYTLSYSESNEQSEWVYYRLTSDMISGNEARTEDFRIDPSITKGSADLYDYKGSGYDRGHLCPAGDMRVNTVALCWTLQCHDQKRNTM